MSVSENLRDVKLTLVSTSALTRLDLNQVTVQATQVDLCFFLKVTIGIFCKSKQKDSLSFGYIFLRYVQIGVASFGSLGICASKPGGFSRMTYDVMQWIRKVKGSQSFLI